MSGDPVGDFDNLICGFPLAEDSFGVTAPHRAVVVNMGEPEVLVGL